MITYMLLIVGFALLIKGADFLVKGASSIAKILRVSDLIVGLTIVAFGTSMQELVVNIFSSAEGNSDIAIGNIVGSNIFNILFILGISALIRPITLSSNSNIDIGVAAIASLMLFIVMFTGKKPVLDRWEGFIFVLIYVIYTVFLIVRG